MSPIIDLQRRLVEVGRIRMGAKDERGFPKKLGTWRCTSRDKDRLLAIAQMHGGDVRPWAEREGEFEVITETDELAIMLLPGQTLSQWHELWSGGGCQRRCDGEREILSDQPCLCDVEPGERKCKPTTRLSVMLPDIPGLGCWRLESHGYYAAVELAATSHMLEQATVRGQLLPARLRIDQRRQVRDGKTTRYAVPVIDIDITMREALPLATQDEIAHTPAPDRKALDQGVTIAEGLAATEQPAATNTSGRGAAPIPSQSDEIGFGEPVPVVDEDEAGTDEATVKQKKKLDVLVGTLRDKEGRITTEQLWRACGRTDLMAGIGADGELHWAPLRESLSFGEASSLIDRLERYASAGLSAEELREKLTDIPIAVVTEAGASLFPGRSAHDLNDQERLMLWMTIERSLEPAGSNQ